jgi:hypothetical protein
MLDRFSTLAVAAILSRMMLALSRPTIFQPAVIKQDGGRNVSEAKRLVGGIMADAR